MTSTDTTAIEAGNLSFSYGRFPVLNGVDLTIPSGHTVCLTGENGCGKSTLLKVLVGQLPRATGELRILGQEVPRRTRLQHVGYVPQANVMSKISFPITSAEVAVQGLARDFGWIKIPSRRHREHTARVFARMGLSQYLNVPFGELSGGLQQRVMITRALLTDPKLLVLDEPTAGVDTESRVGFLQLLEHLRRDMAMTILIVTHDVALVTQHLELDRVYAMEGGTLVDACVAV